jgi:GNAT superfamily N-acetyltransferase
MPDGVTIVSLGDHPERAAGMYDVACESLPDIPGEGDWTPPPRERWLAGLPPDAFVAVAAEEVVGYGIVRVRGDIGMHGITAVKRAWRRRGVARAIKNAQIAWAKQHGLTTLRTANEVRNEPMRKLNRALGYVPTRVRLVLRGPLS